MDDLASPLERALIAYNVVERALLRAPLRNLAPLVGLILLGATAALTLILVRSGQGEVFTGGGVALHGVLALLGLVLSAGLGLARHAAALLALYPAVLVLQAPAYLLAAPRLFASPSAQQMAMMALGVEMLVLVVMAIIVARSNADG